MTQRSSFKRNLFNLSLDSKTSFKGSSAARTPNVNWEYNRTFPYFIWLIASKGISGAGEASVEKWTDQENNIEFYSGSSAPTLIVSDSNWGKQRSIQFLNDGENLAITGNINWGGGAPATADKIVDENAAGASEIQQANVSVEASTDYMASVYIKKDDDENRFPELIVRNDSTNDSFGVQLNTKTGEINDTRIPPDSSSVADAGDFWRLALQYTTAINDTDLDFRIFPAIAEDLGAFDSNATGSIIAFGAQLEKNNKITNYEKTTSTPGSKNLLTWSENFAKTTNGWSKNNNVMVTGNVANSPRETASKDYLTSGDIHTFILVNFTQSADSNWFGEKNTGEESGILIRMNDNSGTDQHTIALRNNADEQVRVIADPINDGISHLVEFKFKNASGSLDSFVDGSLVGSNTNESMIGVPITGANPLTIGEKPSEGLGVLSGSIPEVVIFKQILPESERIRLLTRFKNRYNLELSGAL